MRAAELLHCSVFDLLERPDLDWWLACAGAYQEFEAWATERAQSKP